MGSKRQPPADRGADSTIDHGTDYAYDKRGCRCGKCVLAYREHRRALRKALAEKTPPEMIPHGLLGYSNYKCRCEACSSAGAAWRTKNHADRIISAKRRNAKSADAATRHGQMWTGAEMEVANRTDLTDVEVGQMLGRTVIAVQNMRYLIRHDPKYQRVIGAQDRP